MFTQKLNVDDLQFEKGTFDGTAAYAQNKVRGATAGGGGVKFNARFVFVDRERRCFLRRGGPPNTKESTSPP